MALIDRPGTFRGNIVESSFGTTKNGYPQFVAKFQATQMYDQETKQWLDWSQYEETEITGYLVLAGKDGNFGKNAEQLMKALGWSGTSFSELDEADYSKTLVQFRVAMDNYNGKPTLKVVWVDNANAEPGSSLKKMDKSEVKALDAKFAKAFKALTGGAKPKSVPVGKPADPTPSVGSGTTSPATTPTTKTLKPPATKKAESKVKKSSGTTVAAMLNLPATCTEQEAWDQITANVSKEFPEAQVEEAWLRTVEDLGGPEAITDWTMVRDAILEIMADNPIL